MEKADPTLQGGLGIQKTFGDTKNFTVVSGASETADASFQIHNALLSTKLKLQLEGDMYGDPSTFSHDSVHVSETIGPGSNSGMEEISRPE
jgi:hypothetical protein